MKKLLLISVFFLFVSSSVYSAVVWSDEFDGPNIDKNTWTWDAGGHGFGNGQLEYNTALSQNSYIDGGDLVLKAIRENYMGNSFTSARMLTQGRFAFKYGTLEARIKLPNVANGLWPAFWLLGNNFPGIPWPECGEIDILESGSADGIANGTQNELINCAIHYSLADTTYEHQASWDNASNLIPGLTDLSLDYHLYKVEWTPTDLTFYLDGVQFGTWDITAPHLAEYHQPAFPIINIAIGGWNYVQINDPAGITALPTAGSSAELKMDWIRLEDNAFTEIYLGADTEETGTFGVFTETTPVDNMLVYGDDTDPGFVYGPEAAVYPWNNMTDAAVHAAASEGSECWTFDVGAGAWYGMGVFLPNFRNMKNYSDGFLHFDIQSTLTDTMKVGVKSSRGGEFWLPIGDETAEFGFTRDGAWHTISVPLNRFANTDFNTIHQIFMFASDSASASTTISFDNIYWEPSVTRPAPENGSFGVYTEDATHKDAGEFALGVDGDFFVWENTLNPAMQDPYEGTESLSFTSAGLGWFGMAFTPNVKHNLTAFSYPTSKLQFAMKTTATTTFQVGMKSGNVDGVGQKWITFANGSDPYGFVRDGAWHVVEIPMDDILADVDLFEVSQLFQMLGTTDISNIEIDDVCFTGGGDPLTPESGDTNIPPSVSITSPANGTFYNAGDDILIEADATDGDGTGVVTKVEFYEGLNLLGEDLTSPYTFPFNDVAEGAYTFRAKATDPNDASRTSSAVTVYVGTPVLTSISVSPAITSVQTGQLQQFNVAGYNQFGQPFPVTVDWSVDDGGVIDENGLFTPVFAGGAYTVTATDTAGGILSDTASVIVEAGGLCTGDNSSGDYSWEATGDATNPSITFIPGAPGIATTTLNFFYGRTPAGGFPGYPATPNVPVQIDATAGETIYFYYTYNVPEGGERNTMNNKDSFVVGDCQTIIVSDCDGDGKVNLIDYVCFAGDWMAADCDAGNDYCNGNDYGEDGDVDGYDLEVFINNWLIGTPVPGTTPPTTSVTSPASGASFTPGSNITITADAADADGTITRVDFWADAVLLGSDTTAPYSYTWNSVAEGTYLIASVAYDNDDLFTVSAKPTIYVETTATLPTASITSPANGATFDTASDVTITANATDPDGTVTKVEFFQGATKLGEDTTAPYSYTWNSVADGTYVLTAVATDNDTQTTTSSAVTITVQPPVVPTNLIVNGEFETGDMTGWTLNNLGGNSTVVSTTESPRTGSYSAKLVTSSTGAGVRAEMLQTVTGLSGGTSYDFDLWVKGQMDVGGVAWSQIKWFNGTGGEIGATSLINLWAGMSSTTYQAKGGIFTTPAGTASAQISIRVEGGAMVATNTMYVDDVSFE